jgi:hypothetical protein
MRARALATACMFALVMMAAGCATGPFMENPLMVGSQPAVTVENPVYVPGNPASYNPVFERIIDILDDYFEIAFADRWDGRIETFPKIAPGLELFWVPGSPDFDQRLLATTQTIRQRAIVLLQPAENGGYFIDVKVYKELEDLAQPIRATAGAASFRSDNTLERQFQVIDPTIVDSKWIPIGRDAKLEQIILQRLRNCPVEPVQATR